jgi:hypothetical protein
MMIARTSRAPSSSFRMRAEKNNTVSGCAAVISARASISGK